MVEFFYSREARLDLLEIWEHIAADNVDAADRVEQEIQRAVVMLPTIRGSVISDAI